MKLTTALMLSTLGMALSSVSVWALVPPGGDPGSASARTPSTPSTPAVSGDVATIADLVGLGGSASFSSGSTLLMEGRLGHATLAADRETETYLFLDVKAQAEGNAAVTTPVDLAIVLDRSGSMQGQRMNNALAAAQGMIRRMRDGDTVSVVGYNTSTQILLQPTRIDSRTRELALASLRGVDAQGNTCVSCGVEAAMDLLARGEPGAVQRILLLSDGEANTGVRDVDGFRRLGDRARGMETAVSSIGVDVDYNERVLFALSQSSNGRHYFVDDPSGLPRIFDDELQSLVTTVAAGANVEIDLAPGVTVTQVFDRTFEQRGDRVTVPFGAFSADDEKTVLLRLRVPAGERGKAPIAQVRMRYQDLVGAKPGDCEGQLVAMRTRDAAELSELDPLVEARLARSETSAALALANEQFESGDIGLARKTLESSRGRIRTRRDEVAARPSAPASKAKIDADFERQIDAFDSADQGFGAAQQSAPSPQAASESRDGKRQVRSNADLFDDLGL
ncbi:MAG: VWA domain-containing protein [Deltaproteobacteria bacterium]|nr:VWA domain-containing protein [Nannocystaceae bacterium]